MSKKSALSKREKGKIAELYVISKLVASEIDVYTPVLDIGVDCVIRVQGQGGTAEYYEFQIKGAKYKNVSIRAAQKVIQYAKSKPTNYYLVIPLRRNGEYKEIIYLTTDDIMRYKPDEPYKDGTYSINIPAPDREKFIENQSLVRLLEKVKNQ